MTTALFSIIAFPALSAAVTMELLRHNATHKAFCSRRRVLSCCCCRCFPRRGRSRRGGGPLSNCCCFQIFVMNILNIKGLPRCDNWTIAYFIFHISIEVYNLIDSNVVVHLWLGYTLHFSPFSPCSAISGVIAVHTKVENYYCCCC